MHLGHNNIKYTTHGTCYTMKIQNAQEVRESVSTEKDLDVRIDDKLNFSSHISHVVSKANQVLRLPVTKRFCVYKDIDIVKRLFTALVRPCSEYANVVAHPRFTKDIEQLQKVQAQLSYSISDCVARYAMYKGVTFPLLSFY